MSKDEFSFKLKQLRCQINFDKERLESLDKYFYGTTTRQNILSALEHLKETIKLLDKTIEEI